MGVVPGPRRGDCDIARAPDLTPSGPWAKADLDCRSGAAWVSELLHTSMSDPRQPIARSDSFTGRGNCFSLISL